MIFKPIKNQKITARYDPNKLCYCFGWTKDLIKDNIEKTGKTNALEDIKNKIKTIGCNCATLNPSGKCCLKDVEAFILLLKSQ